jgi:hypothetical protein
MPTLKRVRTLSHPLCTVFLILRLRADVRGCGCGCAWVCAAALCCERALLCIAVHVLTRMMLSTRPPLQEERWKRSIGARVVVDGRGDGVLRYYGVVSHAQIR